jgi:ATP/maltotriose-dependent transcriptional regulator MalT
MRGHNRSPAGRCKPDFLVKQAIVQDADREWIFSYPLDCFDGDLDDALDALTPRERDIVALLFKGYPNKQVATTLTVATNTLKTHLKNIYRKIPQLKAIRL